MCFCSLLSAPLYKLSSSSHMFSLQLVSTLRRLRSSTFFNHLRLQKSINFNPQTSEDFNSFRILREYFYIQYILINRDGKFILKEKWRKTTGFTIQKRTKRTTKSFTGYENVKNVTNLNGQCIQTVCILKSKDPFLLQPKYAFW